MTEQSNAVFPDVETVREPELEVFWSLLDEGKLLVPYCTVCQFSFWPPRAFCPGELHADIEWRESAGTGVVHSFTVVHRGEGAFAAASPYVLAYVELSEGPRVLTNIVGDPAQMAIGLPVVAVIERSAEHQPVLRFRLLDE